VAHSFFSDAVQMASPEQTSSIVDTCVFIHQSVERKSKDFFEELRR
jgi:dynein heavy chain